MQVVEQFYWASKYGAAPIKYRFSAYNLTAGKMVEFIDRWNNASLDTGVKYALDKESLCK
jgi:hypothetical protein